MQAEFNALVDDIKQKGISDAWLAESPLDWGFFPSSLVSRCHELLLRDAASHVIYLPGAYKHDAWNKFIEDGGKEEKEFLEKLAHLSDLSSYRWDATGQAPEQTPKFADPSTKIPEQANHLPIQQNADSPVIPQRTRTVDSSIHNNNAPLPRPGAKDAAAEVLVL